MNISVIITEKGESIQKLSFDGVDLVDKVILALQAFQYEYDAQQDAKTHDNN